MGVLWVWMKNSVFGIAMVLMIVDVFRTARATGKGSSKNVVPDLLLADESPRKISGSGKSHSKFVLIFNCTMAVSGKSRRRMRIYGIWSIM